jgi:multiple sugar transport system ATP-binding protein
VTHDQVEAMTMGTRICVMSAGELQQIDTPFNLYHNPRNVFVAGFMGSPSMNFFDATLSERDGKLVIDAKSFAIPVPMLKIDAFRSHIGKRVIFGIRPEDVHDIDFQPAGITPAIIEANVDVVEQMGNEMILYLEEQGKSFLARTDPRTHARVGQRLTVALDTANIHLFDADTQQSLLFDYKASQAAEKVTQ